MLFVGEAPGKEESRRLLPFQGRTGQAVRRTVRRHGLDPETDVRWQNVCPRNPGALPKGRPALEAFAHRWWDNLAEDLAVMRPRVIVACGGLALYRLTGKHGILHETGGMIVPPAHVMWGGAGRMVPTGVPEGTIVVPVVHPAAVMRTKIGARWLQIDAAIERASKIALGRLAMPEGDPFEIRHPAPGELDDVLANAAEVAIDTEFDPETNVPFMVGMTVDGWTVYSFRPNAAFASVLARHMTRRDLLKIAHYHMAEVAAFQTIGVDTTGPWWDTLEGFSHLWPDLPASLATATLLYFDGWWYWKDMAHDDERYNARDVVAAWGLKAIEQRELADAGLLDVFLRERMPIAPLLRVLEDRGLQVDQRERERKIADSEQEEARLLARIATWADTIYGRRIEEARAAVLDLEERREALLRAFNPPFACPVKGHGEYLGAKAKKWSSNPECRCRELYDRPEAAALRGDRKTLGTARTAPRGQVKRWEGSGFDPGNNDHLRWLLYKGLGLPVQRKDGKPTANADAIARLLAMEKVRAMPGVAEGLKDIKDVQHLRKMRSTFLFKDKRGRAASKIDLYDVVHPPYRSSGTGTGRPAGGAGEETTDRQASPYAFNALNIPEDMRSIYVPHRRLSVYVGSVDREEVEREEVEEDE